MAETLIDTTIVGIEFRGMTAVRAAAKMARNEQIRLEREPHNPFDGAAIAVYYRGHHIGYIPRVANGVLAPALDRGAVALAVIEAPAAIDAYGHVRSEPKIRISLAEPQL